MQRLIRFKVVYEYDRKKYLRQDGTAPVVIRAYQNRITRHVNTGVYISPEYWCNRTNQIKAKHPRHQLFNATIKGVLRDLEAFEAETIRHKGSCSIHDLNLIREDRPKGSFMAFFRLEMMKEKNRVQPATYKTYQQTLSKMEAFTAD